MGAFGTGFLSSLGDALHTRAAQARDQENKKKEQEAAFHWGALQAAVQRGGYTDPSTQQWVKYTPDDYQAMLKQTTDNVSKAYGNSKPVKEIFNRAQQIMGKVTGHPMWGQEHKDDAAQGGGDVSGQQSPSGIAPPPGGGPAAPGGAPTAPMTAPAPVPSNRPAPQDLGAGTGMAIPPPPGAVRITPAPSSVAQGPTDGMQAATKMQTAAAPEDATTAPAPPMATAKSAVAPPVPPPPSSVAQAPTNGMQAADKIQQSAKGVPAPAVPPPNPPVPAATAPAPEPASTVTPPPSGGTAPAAAIPSAPATTVAPPATPPAQLAKLTPQQKLYMFDTLEEQKGRELQTQWQYDQKKLALQHQFKMEEEIAQAQAKASNPTGRPVGGPQLSVQNAREIFSQNAEPYMDQDGAPIDIANLPDNMGLKEFFLGNRSWYVPFSPNDKMVMVGGHVYASDPMNVAGLLQGQGANLGLQRGSTSTASQASAWIQNADGSWTQLTGTRTTTPGGPGVDTATPPPSGAPATKTAKPGISAPPNAAPIGTPNAAVPTGVAASNGQPTPMNAKTKKAATVSPIVTAGRLASGGRTLPPGATPGPNVANMQRRYTAVNLAGQGLQQLVAPQPDGHSNLDIFKDPAAIKRIGDYLKLNNEQMEGEFESAQHGGADGVLSFYAGLPQAYTVVSNQAIRHMYNQLPPADQRFVTDYYFLMGTWGGMRAATGASASLWNFHNLAQEIPNPMSMTSYPEARQKIKDMIREYNQAVKPNTTANPIDVNQMLPPQKSKPAVTPPPAGSGPSATAHKIQVGDKFYRYNGTGETADLKNYTEVPK